MRTRSSGATSEDAIIYPDSDGKPMADNTLQFQWIVTIKDNLEALFADRPDVFVAGDLLWYPVKGNPRIRRAPDALVAIGRPKGYRGSYIQWHEGGVAPQVVFEILSPKNTAAEMAGKLAFYERYGVEEYYLYDPDDNLFEGWLRQGERLAPLHRLSGWTSPRLSIRFVPGPHTLVIERPDGRPFMTFTELQRQAEAAEGRAEAAEGRAEAAEGRAEALAARLRALGIDPDAKL